MEFDFNFWPLFLVLALAWVIPILVRQLHFISIPSVVVEIMAGFIIGEHVLGILPHEEYMEFLGLIGFIFLMFLSGLEINVNQIYASLPKRKITMATFLANPLLAGLGIYAGTLILAYLSAYFLSFLTPITHYWYFALIISTTSVGIIMPVLKERGEISKHFGQMMVMAAAVADILSILFFTFTASYLKKGFEFEILLIFSLFVVLILSYYIGKLLVRTNFFKSLIFQLSHASYQIKVRGTLALILLFLILSQWIDAEVILGAFLAGILMSFFAQKERSSLLLKLEAMGYGFFVPIFFIMVGAGIDLEALKNFDQSFLFLALLLLALYLIKVVPSFALWNRLFGNRQALAGGLLMSSRMSLIIAASQVGLDLGVITPATNTAFIIMAVITCMLSPFLYNFVNPQERYRSDKTVIVGGGQIGVQLAESLQMHDKSCVILELDKRKVNDLDAAGLNVVHGNGADAQVYRDIGLQPNNYVVVLTDSDSKNFKITQILRRDLQHEKVLTYAYWKSASRKMKNKDIEVIDVSNSVASAIENFIFLPKTYYAIFENFESFSIQEIEIKNRLVDGEQLKNLNLHQDGFIMMLKKDGELYVAHEEDLVERGDVAIVFGSDTALENIRKKLTGSGE